MLLYERSLKGQLIGICLLNGTSILQLILSLASHMPIVCVILYSMSIGAFSVLVIPTSIDLVLNDPWKVICTVAYIEEYRIHVRKPNGKLMKIRVTAKQYEQFYVDQTLELLIGKRTDALLAIYSVDPVGESMGSV